MNQTPADLSDIPEDVLAHGIRELAGLAAAAQRHLAVWLAAYADTDDWRVDGATSPETWASAHVQVSAHNARELIRVGRALRDLPAIDQALCGGAFSFDAARAMTWFATPESDESLASSARGHSIEFLERSARRARSMSAAKALQEMDADSLRYRWNAERTRVKGSFDLAALGGGVVCKTLERLADQLERDGGEPAPPDHRDRPAPPPTERRLAQALIELASTHIADDTDADRASMVVFTDLQTLTGGNGLAETEQGSRLSAESVRRLACDCRIEFALRNEWGDTIGIGRASRNVPPWLARQVMQRDGGMCTFPGCGRRRWLKNHHILAWEDGGPTDLNNLTALCFAHHVLVHEGGWRTMRNASRTLVFVRPDGRPLIVGPWPMSARTREVLYGNPNEDARWAALLTDEPPFADTS